jgi:hypothetical protein
MKTPVRVSGEQFTTERVAWIAENCVTDGELQRCRKCKTPVEIVAAFISIHDARFEDTCAGAGIVVRLAIPYCPKCEPRPAQSGCFHEYPARRNNPMMS